MPIIAINSKPLARSLQAAYRPVFFSVSATASSGTQVPPAVYCDIYFDGIFYKTIAKSQYRRLNGTTSSEWEFDIQDAGQEYLRKFIPFIGATTIQQAPTLSVSVFVRFRSSGFDSNGFIQTDGVAPVQATSSTAAVAGTGTQSATFFILNTTIQNEETANFENNLDQYKYDGWNADIFPLTHRPNPYRQCRGDNDYFPIFDKNGVTMTKLRLNYKLLGQTTMRAITVNISPMSGNALFVPNGTKNLAPVFSGVNFNDVELYYVQGLNSSDVVQFSTTINVLTNGCDDNVRIYFVNYNGAIDAINFRKKTIDHDTKSTSFETPRAVGADRTDFSVSRYNITANDTYQVSSIDFNEADMDWLQQLFDSPAAWMEMDDVYFEGNIYVPIVILDGKLPKLKADERYTYETELTYRLSHEKVTLRN